jgi:hypothetical protein
MCCYSQVLFSSLFHAFEEGQYVGVTSTATTLGCPAIVVAEGATHVEHAVDGAAAAQGFAGRPEIHPVVSTGVGLRLIAPVEFGIAYDSLTNGWPGHSLPNQRQ